MRDGVPVWFVAGLLIVALVFGVFLGLVWTGRSSRGQRSYYDAASSAWATIERATGRSDPSHDPGDVEADGADDVGEHPGQEDECEESVPQQVPEPDEIPSGPGRSGTERLHPIPRTLPHPGELTDPGLYGYGLGGYTPRPSPVPRAEVAAEQTQELEPITEARKVPLVLSGARRAPRRTTYIPGVNQGRHALSGDAATRRGA